MTNKQTEAILRNEGTSKRKNPSLPSGTFTMDGSPTIVLDLIGVKVAGEILMGANPKRINSKSFGREIVDCLDNLGLLPINITKDQKVSKIGQQIAWMITDQPVIKSGQVHLYSACKRSYRKAMTSLKIAAKN
jgi:hypothetical protein